MSMDFYRGDMSTVSLPNIIEDKSDDDTDNDADERF